MHNKWKDRAIFSSLAICLILSLAGVAYSWNSTDDSISTNTAGPLHVTDCLKVDNVAVFTNMTISGTSVMPTQKVTTLNVTGTSTFGSTTTFVIKNRTLSTTNGSISAKTITGTSSGLFGNTTAFNVKNAKVKFGYVSAPSGAATGIYFTNVSGTQYKLEINSAAGTLKVVRAPNGY